MFNAMSKDSLGRRQGDQPLIVMNCIAGMGEIDLIDCFLGAFCPQIIEKNVWRSFFVNAIYMVL